jgi:uncharacterized protein (DUF58 family)
VFGRRKITICREGWYYLFVLSFIIGGAILRQVNLLVVLAGLMFGPLLFHWRLVAATLRRITVRRRLPERICAGDLLTVDLIASNGRRRLDSWGVVVNDSIQLEGAIDANQRTSVDVMFPHLAAGESDRVSYRSILSRRGRYRFGPLKVSTRFPLGLVQGSLRIDCRDSLIVCPRLGHLTRQWAQVVEADRAGAQRSYRRQGLVEGDFFGLRDWRTGDSRRWIHWRTSAKLSGLAVKQFEQQRSRDLALVLDLWHGSQPTDEELENVELAVSFAATAVADLCRRAGSHLMLAVAGQAQLHIAATASAVMMHEVLEQLALVEGAETNNLPGVLRRVVGELRSGARAVVISTRPNEMDRLRRQKNLADDPRIHSVLSRLAWIDVSGDQLSRYFHFD